MLQRWAVLALLLLSACADADSLPFGVAATSLKSASDSSSPPSSVSPRPCPAPASVQPVDDGSVDDKMAKVGREVPEFAGLAIDEKAKTWIVMVTDGSQSTAARAKAAYDRITGGGADTSLQGYRITAKKVRFSWLELYNWYPSASRLVRGAMEVRMTDIDEGQNQLGFGVADPNQNRACVDAGLKKLGIPAAAYSIDQQEPIRNLTDRETGTSAPTK